MSGLEAIVYGIGVNSTNRLHAILRYAGIRPASEFWPIFHLGWPCCDATWWLRSHLLSYLRWHHLVDPGPNYLQDEDRAFFDELPELIEVHRGCSRPRVRGVSWTTDRAVAKTFARGHRGIRLPEPVVATAMVPKAAIFATFTERNESEIVLDPRRLRRVRIAP